MTVELPTDLADRLRTLRSVAKLAVDPEQQARARNGTAQLILAMHAVGWSYAAIARSQHLSTQAVSMYAAKARDASITGRGQNNLGRTADVIASADDSPARAYDREPDTSPSGTDD